MAVLLYGCIVNTGMCREVLQGDGEPVIVSPLLKGMACWCQDPLGSGLC